MKYRDYFTKTNPYDVLCDMNRKMKKGCIMECLPLNFWERCCLYEDCESCIAALMDEERSETNAAC